jgi:hypothetical protein
MTYFAQEYFAHIRSRTPETDEVDIFGRRSGLWALRKLRRSFEEAPSTSDTATVGSNTRQSS